MVVAAAAALGTTVEAPSAHADAADVVATRAPLGSPNKLSLVLGLASPWGEAGIAYQRKLSDSFALEGGLGTGLTGAQVVLLPKVLFGSGTSRLYLEAGPSLTFGDTAGLGLWATSEVGFESSFGKWTLGFGAGAGVLVAGGFTGLCFDTCSISEPGKWMPEIRLTVGRNF
jgi:hypothetical protein